MDNLKAVFARVRLPLFSVKHPETFQVMSCLPVPQPSALIGALAYCLGTLHGSGLAAYEYLKRRLEGGNRLAARAKLMGVTAQSSVVMRRFRIADEFNKRKQFYELLDEGDIVGGKRFLESKLTDAFYRGYAMGNEILCAWVLGADLEVDEKMVRLLQRLGDTESLISVSEAWAENVEVEAASVIETSFPFPFRGAKIRRGDFMITKMCNERRLSEQFVIPIKHEVRHISSGRVIILEPTEIEAEFPQPTHFCETSVGTVIM